MHFKLTVVLTKATYIWTKLSLMNLIHKAQWDEVDVFFYFFRKVIEAYHFQVRLHVTLILILVYAF